MGPSPVLADKNDTKQQPNSQVIPLNTDDLFLLSFSSEQLRNKIQQLLVPEGHPVGPVIWEDGESDVIVHVDKLRLAIKPSLALFEVHLEADNVGLVTLVIPFKIGKSADTASLIISTEHLPRGNPLMAHRWGEIVQEHLWFALLEAGEQFKASQFPDTSIQICGLYTDGKQISYLYSEPVSATEIQEYAKAIEAGEIPPKEESTAPSPINLDPPSPETPDCDPPHDCQPAQEQLSVLLQLWREWLALIRQTLRFSKKLAWVVVQISKKLKK